jgi:putative addiction module component (TIGR02574 family)
MIAAADIEQMSLTERLQAMEILWRSISTEPNKLKSPAWHKAVLKKRLAKVESGKAEFLSITQLKKRLARRTS